MLQKQKEYIDYIEEIKSKVNNIINTQKLDKLEADIKNQELLVPVIGGFSAGKSTMINMFLQENILKVDILPETALATEIRYSQQNYIQTISKNDEIEEFDLSKIDEIKQNAKNYKYMRLFLNNHNLKKIEPLVLVDMPGFDSPVDLHNEAILNYLDKGVHFIVLVSVEEGNIPKSLLRQLLDIKEFGKDFSFFLSKANLKSNSDVEEIKEMIDEQIEDELDIQKEIIPIGNESAKELEVVLNTINPNKLIEKLFLEELKLIYLEIEESFNTTIKALTSSKDENEDTIKELQESIENLEKTKQTMIAQAQQRYSSQNVSSIISAVEREIVNSLDSLSRLALTNQEAFEREIMDIVRSTLIYEIKSRITQISEDITNEFSLELQSNIQVDIKEDFVVLIAQNILTLPHINKIVTTMLGSLLKFLPAILNPVIGIIIAILPHVIGKFFELQKEKRQQEQIKQEIIATIIPSIKLELTKTVKDIFTKEIDLLIEKIAKEFEEQLLAKEQEIQEAQKLKEEKAQSLQEEINKYKQIQQEIKEKTYSCLYKDN